MTLEKTKFENYTLDEDKQPKDKGVVFSVRLNEEEYLKLMELKRVFDTNLDSKALKMGAWVGLNVLHSTFGRELLGYLFKKERVRKDDI